MQGLCQVAKWLILLRFWADRLAGGVEGPRLPGGGGRGGCDRPAVAARVLKI